MLEFKHKMRYNTLKVTKNTLNKRKGNIMLYHIVLYTLRVNGKIDQRDVISLAYKNQEDARAFVEACIKQDLEKGYMRTSDQDKVVKRTGNNTFVIEYQINVITAVN